MVINPSTDKLDATTMYLEHCVALYEKQMLDELSVIAVKYNHKALMESGNGDDYTYYNEAAKDVFETVMTFIRKVIGGLTQAVESFMQIAKGVQWDQIRNKYAEAFKQNRPMTFSGVTEKDLYPDLGNVRGMAQQSIKDATVEDFNKWLKEDEQNRLKDIAQSKLNYMNNDFFKRVSGGDGNVSTESEFLNNLKENAEKNCFRQIQEGEQLTKEMVDDMFNFMGEYPRFCDNIQNSIKALNATERTSANFMKSLQNQNTPQQLKPEGGNNTNTANGGGQTTGQTTNTNASAIFTYDDAISIAESAFEFILEDLKDTAQPDGPDKQNSSSTNKVVQSYFRIMTQVLSLTMKILNKARSLSLKYLLAYGRNAQLFLGSVPNNGDGQQQTT